MAVPVQLESADTSKIDLFTYSSSSNVSLSLGSSPSTGASSFAAFLALPFFPFFPLGGILYCMSCYDVMLYLRRTILQEVASCFHGQTERRARLHTQACF